MHPEMNTQHTKIETTILQSIFTSFSPTITLIVQRYIGLQKKLSGKKYVDNRLAAPCKAQNILCECDTLTFIVHDGVKPDRIAYFYGVADILHENVGDPFIAL